MQNKTRKMKRPDITFMWTGSIADSTNLVFTLAVEIDVHAIFVTFVFFHALMSVNCESYRLELSD